MATDELRLSGLGGCHSRCPACGSDDWKSAKLVVLENTTNIEGGGRGDIRDPGMFGGSVREFFLSERWFSWDNPIDLRLELTATTKLVEEVKNFMLSHSGLLASPKRHVRPNEWTFFIGYKEPVPPKRRISKPVTIPEPPVSPDPPKRRTFKQHVSDLFWMIAGMTILALLLVAISSIFVDVTMKGTMITVGGFLVLGIFAHKDLPKTTYESDTRKYEKLQEKYLKAKQTEQDHPERLIREEKEFREERGEYRRSRASYLRRRKEYEAEVRRYETEGSEHAGRVQHIESLRELVWKSARVCMRCGKCYLGERID